MDSILKAEQISFRYHQDWVLEGIGFALPKMAFLGIIGPNASGKTTLLKLLDGILKPQRGRVFLEGTDMASMRRREIARRLAMVAQEAPPVFLLTAFEIVLMGRAPYLGRLGFEKTRDKEIARHAMEMTGVSPLAGRDIISLSGGEKQRVFIARALAQEPEVLLLDEPTAFLDIRHQVEIMELLVDLNAEERMTVVMVSHDINLASQYCRHLMLIDKGRIHSMGDPDQVITEENIREVYNSPVIVDRNPVTGSPRISLLGRGKKEASRQYNSWMNGKDRAIRGVAE